MTQFMHDFSTKEYPGYLINKNVSSNLTANIIEYPEFKISLSDMKTKSFEDFKANL